MKIAGHELKKASIEYVVIPRGHDPETGAKIPDVVFQCQPVASYATFDAQCSAPKPPEVIKSGGRREPNVDDPTYRSQTEKYAQRKIQFLIIESLRATPGLEWETVTDDPKTWGNYEQELMDAGFSAMEVNRIVEGCLAANSLNQKRIDEALADFLHGRAAE